MNTEMREWIDFIRWIINQLDDEEVADKLEYDLEWYLGSDVVEL